jgi:predicted O-linked N-acetylglucosamine transferase (SPINDLY family)
VAGSILHSLGLPELVTTSFEEYEAMALKLATDRPLLASLRARLAAAKPTAQVFDTVRQTRNIERALIQMVEISRRGEPPRSFSVSEDR